ncbi:hypothetical protein L873DRAFT_1795281 [Choiromyces venosus 120613-1]|uniref:Uncharacterized protein n=1 Tax=Choiromyces venosus 120613-1 TaxID=1336337 RepID=A0A3N4J0Q2_9PEZI|nr:hypothetical protein L873DRAFT_1795281 [Choiromyces venosus 120613-1]
MASPRSRPNRREIYRAEIRQRFICCLHQPQIPTSSPTLLQTQGQSTEGPSSHLLELAHRVIDLDSLSLNRIPIPSIPVHTPRLRTSFSHVNPLPYESCFNLPTEQPEHMSILASEELPPLQLRSRGTSTSLPGSLSNSTPIETINQSLDAMSEIKLLDFGGAPGENVEHFLYGFEIFFEHEARKAGPNATTEPSETMAYRVIQHIKPGKYIKITRKIACGMSSGNQHLVATQFVKGLDSRELRVQAMSGMANRPMVEEAIMKVRRLHDVIGSQGTGGFGDETEESKSESESESESEEKSEDDRDDNGYGRRRKRKGGKGKGYFQEYRKMKKGSSRKRDKKQLKEEKIMQELEELKQLLKGMQKGNQMASDSCGITEEFTGYANYGNYRNRYDIIVPTGPPGPEGLQVRFHRREEPYGNMNSQDTGGKRMDEVNGEKEQEYAPSGETNGAKASPIMRGYSSALMGMVVEVVSEREEGRQSGKMIQDMTDWKVEPAEEFVRELTGRERAYGNRLGHEEPEVMAGERAQLRSQFTESSGSQEPGLPRQQARTSLDPVVDQERMQKRFWDTQVTGLTWGQFFDLSPEGKRQFVRLIVQERLRIKSATGKRKDMAEARVVEAALSEAALAGKYGERSEVTNFYIKARISIDEWTFEINHVLIDAGAVVNLAPIMVLHAIGAKLFPTKDLVIQTAASNLIPLQFYANLEIEVASVMTPIRVFAMLDSCEPTYGLLLSRRWLRVCEAVGDYSKDTYVIKDREGRNHDVPREGDTQQTLGTPKVSMNPQVTNCMLEEELVAELELDNY